jgi:hypothetical protein
LNSSVVAGEAAGFFSSVGADSSVKAVSLSSVLTSTCFSSVVVVVSSSFSSFLVVVFFFFFLPKSKFVASS